MLYVIVNLVSDDVVDDLLVVSSMCNAFINSDDNRVGFVCVSSICIRPHCVST